VSYGRNLLGRAFLDAGDPRSAATHFFANYQANKQADRAPDSLLYLAEAMAQLNDTRRACIALAEFGETYPALAAGRLAGQYGALAGRVDCD
jgi:TolA-binding protein